MRCCSDCTCAVCHYDQKRSPWLSTGGPGCDPRHACTCPAGYSGTYPSGSLQVLTLGSGPVDINSVPPFGCWRGHAARHTRSSLIRCPARSAVVSSGRLQFRGRPCLQAMRTWAHMGVLPVGDGSRGTGGLSRAGEWAGRERRWDGGHRVRAVEGARFGSGRSSSRTPVTAYVS